MKFSLWQSRPVLPRCIRQFIAAFVCLLAAFSATTPAHARFQFGPEENLRQLEDVRLQNSAKEALFIGHKVTFHWIGLPFTVSDDGYILGVKGKSVYYPLDKERLTEWQAQGLLPNPLPTYELHAADYVFGHLLWIVLAGWAMWRVARVLISRLARKPAAAVPPLATPSPPPARVAQAINGPANANGTTSSPEIAPPKSPARTRQAAEPGAAKSPSAASSSPTPASPLAAHAPAGAQASHRPEQQRILPTLSQMRAEAAKLPVAKTVCRVKATKAA